MGVHRNLADAVAGLLESDLPALPVVAPDERLIGIFGERELIGALFPAYLDELRSARFVPRTMDEAREHSSSRGTEPLLVHTNTEHIDVGVDASHAQLAETFLHHGAPIVPVVAKSRVIGVITRRDFIRELAIRFTRGNSADTNDTR